MSFLDKVSSDISCVYCIICTLQEVLSAVEVNRVLNELECPDVLFLKALQPL